MYQQGLQLSVLKVLSTTQSVPNAYTVSCPNGAIESVCIGELASSLPSTFAAESPSPLSALLLSTGRVDVTVRLISSTPAEVTEQSETCPVPLL